MIKRRGESRREIYNHGCHNQGEELSTQGVELSTQGVEFSTQGGELPLLREWSYLYLWSEVLSTQGVKFSLIREWSFL